MHHAMPEAHALYAVTGSVIVGLVVWVAIVLKLAKEPWGRPAPVVVPAEPPTDPDATAQATAVTVPEPPPAPAPASPPEPPASS
jgi:hypothetical protein